MATSIIGSPLLHAPSFSARWLGLRPYGDGVPAHPQPVALLVVAALLVKGLAPTPVALAPFLSGRTPLTAPSDVQALTSLINALAQPSGWTCRAPATAFSWRVTQAAPVVDVLAHTPDLSLAYRSNSATLRLLLTVGHRQWRASCPADLSPGRGHQATRPPGPST